MTEQEYNRLRQRLWIQEHPDYNRLKAQRWRRENPERARAIQQKYYLAHRDEILEKKRAKRRERKQNVHFDKRHHGESIPE